MVLLGVTAATSNVAERNRCDSSLREGRLNQGLDQSGISNTEEASNVHDQQNVLSHISREEGRKIVIKRLQRMQVLGPASPLTTVLSSVSFDCSYLDSLPSILIQYLFASLFTRISLLRVIYTSLYCEPFVRISPTSVSLHRIRVYASCKFPASKVFCEWSNRPSWEPKTWRVLYYE